MNKLTLVMLFCLIESSMASSYFSSFYLKGGIGGTTAQFDITQDFTADNIPLFGPFTLAQPVNHQARGTNLAGLLGFGYSYQMDPLWVLGAEFTMGFTSANTTFHNSENFQTFANFNNKVETILSNDFALFFKPGLVIGKKTQFYALLGTRWGNFETKNQSTSSLIALSFEDSGSAKSNVANYVIGFTVGLGIERMLNDHWSLGLEYAYTAYGDIPSASLEYTTEGTFAEHTIVSNDVTGTAAANTVILDAAYRF